MTDTVFRKMAHVLLESAVKLQSGDILILRAAPTDYLLVREVTAVAYQLGAKFVKVEFEDAANDALRSLYSAEEYLDYYPPWLLDCQKAAMEDRVAVLVLSSPNPVLNAGLDEGRLQVLAKTKQRISTLEKAARKDGHVSMVTTAVPSVQWARSVYPELDDNDAYLRLWDDYIRITYLDASDPVEAWRLHTNAIKRRRDTLNSMHLTALHLSGPGTDLILELAPDAGWIGGCDYNPVCKTEYIPNIPTEEVFCIPHKYRVNGSVRATLPLSCDGVLIRDFSFTIRDGLVVDFSASEGGNALKSILETDPGARRLGEVALVPVTSPIYRTGKVFYHTLLDENAVCHIALGCAPGTLRERQRPYTAAERDAAGLNDSGIHVDFMVGSDKLLVEGVDSAGKRIVLMNNGLFVGALA